MGSGKAEKEKRRRSLEVLVDKQLLIQLRLENLITRENLRRDREYGLTVSNPYVYIHLDETATLRLYYVKYMDCMLKNMVSVQKTETHPTRIYVIN